MGGLGLELVRVPVLAVSPAGPDARECNIFRSSHAPAMSSRVMHAPFPRACEEASMLLK